MASLNVAPRYDLNESYLGSFLNVSDRGDADVSDEAVYSSQQLNGVFSSKNSFGFETGAEVFEDLRGYIEGSYHLLDRDDI